MKEKRLYNKIPVVLKESEFNEFVLPHLKKGSRGPSKKLSFFKIFNYIWIANKYFKKFILKLN